VAQVVNVARSLEELKRLGLWIIGAEANARSRPWEIDLKVPVALVVGGEDRGVRRLVRRGCDAVISIPMAADGLSLNAADAACVLLYEMTRQRRKTDDGA
jgi:23S rRNA (guanosine2251-2'-O)-methyltransferase